jgi:hypothetical protein
MALANAFQRSAAGCKRRRPVGQHPRFFRLAKQRAKGGIVSDKAWGTMVEARQPSLALGAQPLGSPRRQATARASGFVEDPHRMTSRRQGMSTDRSGDAGADDGDP